MVGLLILAGLIVTSIVVVMFGGPDLLALFYPEGATP